MKLVHSFRRSRQAVALGVLFLGGPAFAALTPDFTHLPRCHSYIGADVTCRLPVKNGGFDGLAGWEGLGEVDVETEEGNSYASIGHGSSIRQAVYAMFYKWTGATYALRFRVRSTSGDAQVHVAMWMSDGHGRFKKLIGATAATATESGWRTVELVANGKPSAAPAHVLVEITNILGATSSIDVDDVQLVESADAEAVDVF